MHSPNQLFINPRIMEVNMRYKFIDQYTPPRQITSVTINNVTTSTIYGSKSFDDLVDSIGIGKIFIPTEQPECEEGYYAKASYVDGDVITMVWEVVEVEQNEFKIVKERVNLLTDRADATELAIFGMMI